MEEQQRIWALVTLMGRRTLAGQISEATVHGLRMLQVDVPEVDGYGGFTRFVAPGAIYDIQPCEEPEVNEAVFTLGMKSLPVWGQR